MSYDAGIFVFLPNTPKRNLIPQRLAVPLRPDEHGQWRPLRTNESAARTLLQVGDAAGVASVLGFDPCIFGWFKSTRCLAALLGQVALLALAIAVFA